MARLPLSESALADASWRCAELLATEGVDAPAAELAKAAGMSPRTFFRYFPTKADCVRPLLMQGNRWFVTELEHAVNNSSPNTGIAALVRDSFVRAYEQHRMPGDASFLAMLLEDVHYRRVWLETNFDLQAALYPALSEALEQAEVALAVRAAAAQASTLAATTLTEMVRTGKPVNEVAHEIFALEPFSSITTR